MTRKSDDVERFYFLDSHGDTAFIRKADYDLAATRMRERCVSVVRVWASEHKHAFVGHVIDELYEELERDDVQQAD